MRLSTIWTMPAMALRERLRRTADWVDLKVAAHLPKRVAYWSFILTGTKAMGNDIVIPEALYVDLLERIPGRPRS